MEKKRGVYVAGPMVFWPGGEDLAGRWKALCRERGLWVPECTTQLEEGDSPFQRACRLRSRCVERLVQSDGIIADLDCFRGEEPDSGTLFEVGLGIALGLRIYLHAQCPPAWMAGGVYPDFSAALEAFCADVPKGTAGRLSAGAEHGQAPRRLLLAGGWRDRPLRAGELAAVLEALLPCRLRRLADGCQGAVVDLEDMPGGTEPCGQMAALCGYLYGKRRPYWGRIERPRPMAERIPGAHTAASGRLEDPSGNMIEPFNLPLNLMLATTMEGVAEDGIPDDGSWELVRW